MGMVTRVVVVRVKDDDYDVEVNIYDGEVYDNGDAMVVINDD